jgi:hypothetical protein
LRAEAFLACKEHSSFEILDSVTETVPDTAADLAFNVDEYGWKVGIGFIHNPWIGSRLNLRSGKSGHHIATRAHAHVKGRATGLFSSHLIATF